MSEKMTESGPGWGESWPAPGKLNLLLRIIGRRKDGYHLLQTVFQFIDLCDRILFFPRSDGQVRLRTILPGVPESDDLTVRAARLLKQHSGWSGGVDIEVQKVLPMGGGLGGGSSDAATVLAVLNRIWGLGYFPDQLMEIGLSLGADVPVFVFGQSAWAEGVGEVLKPIRPVEQWYVVLVPDCQVATAEVFSAPSLTRDNTPVTIERFLSGFGVNDCLPVVSEMYPPVKQALEYLSGFGEARLTGTGACVFLAADDHASALAIADRLKGDYRVFVAQGCNWSPLHARMEEFFGLSG
jgi:4-diphosphocytidyl-2-C-methyl-D-erythritol kinase